ncbi:MAG: YdcF family protein [Myxococcota bacterium]
MWSVLTNPFGLALIVLTFVLSSYGVIWAVTTPRRTTILPEGRRVDAALVLGGDPGVRTGAAVALYHAHRINQIIVSGAGSGGDDARVMADWAIRSGVESADILIEPRARTTRENILYGIALAQQSALQGLVIVSDECHLPRAYVLARQYYPQLEVYVWPVVGRCGFSFRFREFIKVLYTTTLDR